MQYLADLQQRHSRAGEMMVRVQSWIYRLNTTNIPFVVGNFVFVSESGSAAMVDAPKAGSVACFLCGKEVVKARMRDHVARHLVAKMLGISESLTQPVGLMRCTNRERY